MMKRMLSILLAAVMMLSVLPAVSAEETAEVVKFDIAGCNPNLESELELGIVFAKENIPEGKEFTATVTQISGGEEVKVFTFAQDEWETYGSDYYRVPVKMAAKCMADDFSIEITDAEGNVWNNPYSTSYRTYVMNNFDKTDDAARQTLFVDMLNYGAAAQERFDYNVDDLANNELTDEQQALSLGNVTLTNVQVMGEKNLGTTASLESRILVYSVFSGMENVEEMYAEVSYVDARNLEKTLTVDGADFELYNASMDAYKVCVDTLVPADVNVAYTMTVYNADGTVFDTAVDGLGSYLARNMEKDPVYGAVATFGMAAKNYFVGDGNVDVGGGNTPDDGYILEDEAIASVQAGEDGTVQEEVTMEGETVSATVPAGVAVEGETLTLKVSTMTESGADVTVEETEETMSLDVHMDGVAESNEKAIIVSLGEMLPKGLNMGNVALYHVEDGETVAMTCVELIEDLDEHNEFYYDPATGEVIVAMASFSEVVFVLDEANVWNGVIARLFAGGTGTEDDPYLIANADQLAYMSKAVSNDVIDETTGEGKYTHASYKLISDVNFGGYDNVEKNDVSTGIVFYPIGYWKEQEGVNKAGEKYYDYGNTFFGTFDGNGNTISGLCQRTWNMDGNYDNGYWDAAMGLFGAVYNATIKNLTMDRFESDGEFTPTGCVAAYAGGTSLFENIQLTNCNPRVYNTANGGVVGLNYNDTEGLPDTLTFRNITVDQTNKITALWGSWDVGCGGILGRLRESSKHNEGVINTVHFENCHVSAIIDVYNDVCANYQYYQYRYCGMMVGTVDYIDMDYDLDKVIFPTDCTVTYGDWNEYWYCELVENTLASYTHDHQFSRLEKISGKADIWDEENQVWTRTGNFVIPNKENEEAAVCYHIRKDANGNLYEHKHEDSGFETFDLDGNGQLDDLKEDRQHYYIPFGQLFTGYGWGSNPQKSFVNDGIEILEGGTVKSDYKFAEKENITTYVPGQSIRLGDLFQPMDNGTTISSNTVFVGVSPYTSGDFVSATYEKDIDNWEDGKITFSEQSSGPAKIVISDYFYCKETVIVLNDPTEIVEGTVTIDFKDFAKKASEQTFWDQLDDPANEELVGRVKNVGVVLHGEVASDNAAVFAMDTWMKNTFDWYISNFTNDALGYHNPYGGHTMAMDPEGEYYGIRFLPQAATYTDADKRALKINFTVEEAGEYALNVESFFESSSSVGSRLVPCPWNYRAGAYVDVYINGERVTYNEPFGFHDNTSAQKNMNLDLGDVVLKSGENTLVLDVRQGFYGPGMPINLSKVEFVPCGYERTGFTVDFQADVTEMAAQNPDMWNAFGDGDVFIPGVKVMGSKDNITYSGTFGSSEMLTQMDTWMKENQNWYLTDISVYGKQNDFQRLVLNATGEDYGLRYLPYAMCDTDNRTLNITVIAQEAGTYDMSAISFFDVHAATNLETCPYKWRSASIMDVYVNGKLIADDHLFGYPGNSPERPGEVKVDLGLVTLNAGPNTFVFDMIDNTYGSGATQPWGFNLSSLTFVKNVAVECAHIFDTVYENNEDGSHDVIRTCSTCGTKAVYTAWCVAVKDGSCICGADLNETNICRHEAAKQTVTYTHTGVGMHTVTETCTCGRVNTYTERCAMGDAVYVTENGQHWQTRTCTECGATATSLAVKCTITTTKTDNGNGTHTVSKTCKCGYEDVSTEDCTMGEVTYVYAGSSQHTATQTCTICGHVDTRTESCTWEGGVQETVPYKEGQHALKAYTVCCDGYTLTDVEDCADTDGDGKCDVCGYVFPTAE